MNSSHTLTFHGTSHRKKLRVKSPKKASSVIEEPIDPFETKYKLFLKIRPNVEKVDINNRLF